MPAFLDIKANKIIHSILNRLISIIIIILLPVMSYGQSVDTITIRKMKKSNDDWKLELSPLQFHILRESGTEQPYTGELDDHYKAGEYHCAACGNYLFSSDKKYNSGCGWPSFSDIESKKNIVLLEDRSGGRIRTEVRCAGCNSHLGHVFKDGPPPTNLRYCINSAALKFHLRK